MVAHGHHTSQQHTSTYKQRTTIKNHDDYSYQLELRMPRSFPNFFTQKIEPYSFQGGLGVT